MPLVAVIWNFGRIKDKWMKVGDTLAWDATRLLLLHDIMKTISLRIWINH